MVKSSTKATPNSPALWTVPPLRANDHKYTRGHVLVYGGAVMTGASRLAALASLRIGAGLVTLAAPEKAWPVYASSLLSVITRPLAGIHDWQKLLEDDRINIVLIGPGAGVNETTEAIIRAAAASGKQLLLDADALTLLAKDEGLRKALKNPLPKGEGRVRAELAQALPNKPSPDSLRSSPSPAGRGFVLTPHEGEYARLAKVLKLDASKDKPARAADLAHALNAVVVLKGADTVIADMASKVVVNTNAPPTLATGGTGDVLAGMVAGLVAQGMTPFDAACAGVYLHGEAASQLGRGMIAEDLLGQIPRVLQK